MPINSSQLGPGTLTFGSGPLDVSLQVTACKITPSESVATTEPVKVLGGEELPGTEDVTLSWVLEGTFLQDLLDSGVVAWSWTNASTEQPFTFTPNTATGASFAGTCIPVPLTVGGDEVEGARMTADFTWRLAEAPTPTWADSTP